jgi:UPF0755 protein
VSIVECRFYRLTLRQLVLIGLIGVVVAALAGAAYVAWYVETPLTIRKLPVEFEIPEGTRFRGAAHILEDAGIEVGPLQFEALARALGRAQLIKAGSYELTAPLRPLELLGKLTRGDVTQAEIRFIEGWTFRQMRAALDESPNLRHDTLAMEPAQIMHALGAPEEHAEGLFFPDTYLFSKGASDLSVLRRAYHATQRHLDADWAERAPDLPYQNPYQALIMASLVEKETGRATDRAMIAGVLVNRLRAGMLLQVDPSVIYGMGASYDGKLHKKDLTADGPYNTYTRTGLPPTPIAMPGLAALRAALHPAKTDDYYYVARGDGTSVFSRTLEQHNRAVETYQRHAARR